MRGDGRKLDRATQAHIRRQVVLAVRKGMTQVEAAKVFGMSLRFVHKACAKARDSGCRFPFNLSLLIFQLALVTLSMCHRARVPASHTHRFSVRRRRHRDFRASHVGPKVVTA